MSDTISNSVQETIDSARLSNQKGAKQIPAAWSVQMADSCIKRSPVLMNVWSYEWGVVLKGVEQVWLDTGKEKYLEYIQHNVEQFVEPDGNIRTYNLQEYNLDQINSGKLLFQLYQVTGDQRYQQALHLLRKQLQTQPRTSEGGFWHKNIYPYQMWLDGIYMAGPFYAQYANSFGEPNGLDDVAHQILLIERHTHDPKTGLFYHGWDESKMQKWANPQTGCSPNFWGRAMGWYAMAIVDVLDFMPPSHQAKDRIVTIFQRMIHSLTRVQDATAGLWYQILDQGGREGNYSEASASCMFVYAIAKGIRKGYLAPECLEIAQRGYAGIIKHLVEVDECGQVNLTGICRVAGLGGKQQRDGSYEYYLSEPVATNDYKGVGPFILASVEMERLSKPA
jgi:unsaturated rhamnogalacturonyl hydrolase